MIRKETEQIKPCIFILLPLNSSYPSSKPMGFSSGFEIFRIGNQMHRISLFTVLLKYSFIINSSFNILSFCTLILFVKGTFNTVFPSHWFSKLFPFSYKRVPFAEVFNFFPCMLNFSSFLLNIYYMNPLGLFGEKI